MAKPRTTSPQGATGPMGPGWKPPLPVEPDASLPADLNGAWRGLMHAVGRGLPYGLNRSVTITRRMRQAVK